MAPLLDVCTDDLLPLILRGSSDSQAGQRGAAILPQCSDALRAAMDDWRARTTEHLDLTSPTGGDVRTAIVHAPRLISLTIRGERCPRPRYSYLETIDDPSKKASNDRERRTEVRQWCHAFVILGERCPRLERLHLEANTHVDKLSSIAKSGLLKHLTLRGCDNIAAVPTVVAVMCPLLTRLELSSSNRHPLASADGIPVQGFAHGPTGFTPEWAVERAADAYSRFAATKGQWLALGASPRAFVHLSLCGMAIADDMLIPSAFPQLKSLDLRHTGVGGTTLRGVAASCPLLEQLRLGGCDEVTAQLIAECGSGWPSLTSLDLASCRAIDGALAAAAAVLPALRDLDIQDCYRVPGAAVLAIGRACPQLRRLAIHGNAPCVPGAPGMEMREAELVGLARACPHLETLQLGYRAAFTDAALLALATDCPLLSTLVFGSGARADASAVTEQGLADARQQSPLLQPELLPTIDEWITLGIMDQSLNEETVRVPYDRPLALVLGSVERMAGVPLPSCRILFDGIRIDCASSTPRSLDMEDGDIVDVVLEQIARPWASPPASARSSASERLLLSELDPRSVGGELIARIAQDALGAWAPPSAGVVRSWHAALGPAQCAAAIAYAQHAHRAGGALELDLKLPISAAELGGLVGASAVSALLQLGLGVLPPGSAHSPPARFLLRRREASEAGSLERIPFHRDASAAVVNVALNSGYRGGRLMYVHRGALACPERPAGSALATNRAVVHGVSALTSGVRYSLIVAFA